MIVPVKPAQPGHAGVAFSEPVAEHSDRFDPAFAGGGSQGGGYVLRVADHVPADLRLDDVSGMFDCGPGWRPRVTRSFVDESLLEADLAQCCGPL